MPMFDKSLDFALALLQQHPSWYLFPIRRYEKMPPLISDNLNQASNDPKQIRAWHAKNPGCNWGIALKKSGLIVVDVDRKEGKRGQETFDDLELMYGFPATMTVQSPSGGLHLYYNATDAVPHQYAQGLYGFGLDVDSTNYVLAPGCWLCSGGGYDIITDAPVADAPEWFAEFLKTREATAADQAPVVNLDQSQNVKSALEIIRAWPPSLEGQGGERVLFGLSARLKDEGVSEAKAVELLALEYNVYGRCDPPWARGAMNDFSTLDGKVHNAYTYAVQNAPGGATAEAHFDVDDDVLDEAAEAKLAERMSKVFRIDPVFDVDATDAARAAVDAALADVRPPEVDDIMPPEDDDPPPAPAPTPPQSPPDSPPPTAPSTPADDAKAAAKAQEKAAATRVKGRPANENARVWTLPELMDEWVYISGMKRFVWRGDLDFRNYVLDVEAFDLAFMYLRGQQTKVSRRLLERSVATIRKFTALGYKPGEDEFVGDLYNMYRPGPLAPIEGDTQFWDDHLAYLFPDEEQRNHVLNWCAWLLQHVSEKPMHALLMAGRAQGTGKTFIIEVLARCLGVHNVANVKDTELESPFNEWAAKSKLIKIEELQALDRGVVKKKLHDLITETRIIINDKNVKRFAIDNCFGVIAMSNEDAAITLGQNDRRYLVVRTHADPRDKDYYETLYGKLRDPAAMSAVFYQLMTRDLAGYSGKDRAPFTEAKAEMIEAGLSDIERWMADNEGNYPMNAPIVTLDDIVEHMDANLRKSQRLKAHIASILKHRFRGESLGQHRVGEGRSGTRKQLWTIGRPASMFTGKSVPALYLKYKMEGGVQASAGAVGDFDEAEPSE